MAVRRTGYKVYTMLRQKDANTGEYTGLTKPNSEEDPDYIPPVYDPATCPVETPNYLYASPTNYNAVDAFDSFAVQIESNTAWTITVDQAWISAPSSGENNATIQITISRNTGSQRYGNVTLTNGYESINISISQQGAIGR